MPPQQRNNDDVVDARMRRVVSTSELSNASLGSIGSDAAAGTPRNAREYRVRKSKLIG